MKQASIKIYKGIKSVNITANNLDAHKLVLRSMLATLLVLGLSYAILIGLMVYNIVERKNMEKEMHALVSEVGALELEYLSAAQEIDLVLARAMGFQETPASFATKRSVSALSVDSNEI